MPRDPEQILLAVLGEAARCGATPLLKTMLVKLVYLVDVHAAEVQNGETATGWQWRFLHYGPYAPAIEDVTRSLEANRRVVVERRPTDDEDKEYVLYRLPHRPQQVPSLSAIGLPKHVELAIAGDMRRYVRAPLRKILDYVYFRTAPMEDAEPGSVLDFRKCEVVSADDMRPVEMRRLRPKAVRRTRNRVRGLIAEIKQSRSAFESGPYDETYYEGLREFEGEPLESGLRGAARIRTRG